MMQLNTALSRSQHTTLPHFCVGPDADCQQISGNTNCGVKKKQKLLGPQCTGPVAQPREYRGGSSVASWEWNQYGRAGRLASRVGREKKQQDRSQLNVTDNFSPPPGILSPPCWIISALTLRCWSWWDDCRNVLSLKMPHHCLVWLRC